jgi:outer membrane protein assembly factor BamB
LVTHATTIGQQPGTKIWEYDAEVDVYSPALSPNGSIYVYTHKPGTQYNLLVVNPNGTKKMESTWYMSYWPPAIAADGTAFVTSGTNLLYALDPDPVKGARFFFEASSRLSSVTTIAADGTIYCVTDYPERKIIAVKPDGTKRWEFDLGGASSWGAYLPGDGRHNLCCRDYSFVCDLGSSLNNQHLTKRIRGLPCELNQSVLGINIWVWVGSLGRMARRVRVEYSGAVYHLLNRGNRCETIFRNEEDWQRFIATLGEVCGKTGCRCMRFA